MKRALICGVSGQDGAYLSRLLLSKGYEVWGTSRNGPSGQKDNLDKLGIAKQINILKLNLQESNAVTEVIKTSNPDEIYILSGPSSVGESFKFPEVSRNEIIGATRNILETCRLSKREVKIYHASSSESFGNIETGYATEETVFKPRSPYAEAKAISHEEILKYRNDFEIFCASGILFNHESPLRSSLFVTKKIVSTAVRISKGSNEKLHLGRLDIQRDWGYAPEYVEAMWQILQLESPEDFVIATGVTNSLEDFVDQVFNTLNLNWNDHVIEDAAYFRPSEIQRSAGNAGKAAQILKWKPTIDFKEMVRLLVKEESNGS